jgi:hypothetical protein
MNKQGTAKKLKMEESRDSSDVEKDEESKMNSSHEKAESEESFWQPE